MTSPADAIKNEVRELIEVQIRIFGQQSQLDETQLQDHRRRCQRINWLCSELDKLVVHSLTARRQ